MCVTEVWSFRECGCFYNHRVLCRPYQIQRSPCFAPNIQYPLDRWLRETGGYAEVASKHFEQQATPTEPQNCLDHRTVEKSFLNQICEDCLLAELKREALVSEHGTTTCHVPTTNADNEKGLVWDSEVKIEIEGLSPASVCSPTVPEPLLYASELVEEDDKMIFESHVEVLIEDDNYTASAGVLSSPIFSASQNSGRSLASTLSVGRSPPGARRSGPCRPSSPTYRRNEDRSGSHKELSDFDDADDEFENRVERFPRNPQSVPRGRLLSRSTLHEVEKCHSDAGILPYPANEKIAGKTVSRLHGLRSLSTTFLSSSKTETVDAEQSPPTVPATTLPPPTPRSRDLFRIRGRKISPLTRNLSVFEPTSPSARVSEKCSSGTPEKPFNVPRKSNLKDFAQLLVPDLKRTRAPRSPPSSQLSSLLQSSPGERGGSDGSDQTGPYREDQKSDSHSDTVFETASTATSLQSDETSPTIPDEGAWTDAMGPSISKSSTMTTLRAVINDLNLGLYDQDTRAPVGSKEEERNKLARSRIADVAELGRMDMLEVYVQAKQSDRKQDTANNPPALTVSHSDGSGIGSRTGLQHLYTNTAHRWV